MEKKDDIFNNIYVPLLKRKKVSCNYLQETFCKRYYLFCRLFKHGDSTRDPKDQRSFKHYYRDAERVGASQKRFHRFYYA